MTISLAQALIISFLYWFSGTTYLFGFFGMNLNWPVVSGFFLGCIMGDPIQGTILGGVLQTLNMAPSMVGNTITMDLKMAAFITIPMAITGSINVDTIIAFAVPFTVLGAFIQPLTRTLNQVALNMADHATETGNLKKYYFATYAVQPLIQLPFYFGVMFLALFFGQHAMEGLLAIIPTWLMTSFIVLSKFLPGIGFAMFLKSINRSDRLPLFFLGFYVFYFFSGAGISLIGITIFGAIIAFMVAAKKKDEEAAS